MKQSLYEFDRPKGFYLYFDRFFPLLELSDEELGGITRAIFLYAELGKFPSFKDKVRTIFFNSIRPSVDASIKKQLLDKLKNSYKAYRRDCKGEPFNILDWLDEIEFNMDELSDYDIEYLSQSRSHKKEKDD